MTVDILLSEDKKEHILRIKDLLNNLFVSSSAYVIRNRWDLEERKNLDSVLGNGDICLVCCNRESLESAWLFYTLGFFEGRGRDVIFFLPEVDISSLSLLKERHIYTEFLPLRENLYTLIEEWNQKMTKFVAEHTLHKMGVEKGLNNFIRIIEDGDRLLAGIFLESGFPVNSVDKDGVSLLSLAVRYDRVTLVKLLCEAGADYNLISSDRNNTPLMDAASSGNNELVDYFLKFSDIDLSVVNKNSQTALLLAAGNKHVSTAKKLIDAGANTEVRDSMGMTPRKYAELYENYDLVEYMEEAEKS